MSAMLFFVRPHFYQHQMSPNYTTHNVLMQLFLVLNKIAKCGNLRYSARLLCKYAEKLQTVRTKLSFLLFVEKIVSFTTDKNY